MNAVAINENVSPITKWNPRKDAVGREITYIDIGSVSQDSKQITNETRMLGGEAPSRARQIISQGDILVSTVRPNLNAVALVPERLDGATASTGFCVLRPIKDRLGLVDKLFDPYPCGDDMYKPQIAFSGFVISCCQSTGIFQLIEAPFDLVSQRIDEIIDRYCLFSR